MADQDEATSATSTSEGTVSSPRPARESYADPRDLQFGTAARDKEERLDEALAKGEPVPADEPPEDRPRPAAKAVPDSERGQGPAEDQETEEADASFPASDPPGNY